MDNQMDTIMKSKLVEMLKWFHNICEENGLRYYALGGTALGAIRHQGFIPWDDDIDVGLPRHDYEKLEIILKNQNSRYILETPNSTNSDFLYTYSKIYDSETTLVERTKHNVVRGIFIDVFPLDGLSDSIGESKKRFNKINFYSKLLVSRVTYIRKGRGIIKNTLTVLSQLIPGFIIDNKKLQTKTNTLCKMYDFDKCKFGGNLLGHWGFKEVMESSIMGTPQLMRFEDALIYVPERYEDYLTNLYGEWRKLPPKEKQITIHDFVLCDLEHSYLEYSKSVKP